MRLREGTRIPKPDPESVSFVTGFRTTRLGETALIYSIRNHTKSVTVSEWEQAYNRLCDAGRFTRAWFNAHMKRSAHGPCGFTTIGGIFSLLGIAVYSRGRYRKI